MQLAVRPRTSLPEATLWVRTSTVEVAAIDDWIEEAGRTSDADKRAIFAARLCVAELAANVLEHGGVGPDGRISVTLSFDGDGIAVAFADTGAPFDPTAPVRKPGNLNESTTAPLSAFGGRGLALIRSFASDLVYRRDGNLNRMTFRIRNRSL